MSDIDFEKVAADMVDILGIDTIMKYFIYRAEADLENSRRCLNLKTYLLLDQSSGYCKIGKTSDITKRIKALSCGNPDIELLFTIDDDVEGLLHETYKDKRVKAEWFALSLKDISNIRRKWCEKYTPFLLKQ